jgi:hypothetical protein
VRQRIRELLKAGLDDGAIIKQIKSEGTTIAAKSIQGVRGGFTRERNRPQKRRRRRRQASPKTNGVPLAQIIETCQWLQARDLITKDHLVNILLDVASEIAE